MLDMEKFKQTLHLSDQLINFATKDDLAECIRLLAINIAHYESVYGTLPLDESLEMAYAVVSAIGFIWTQLLLTKVVPTSTSAPLPININIDAKQINTQTMPSPSAIVQPSMVLTPVRS